MIMLNTVALGRKKETVPSKDLHDFIDKVTGFIEEYPKFLEKNDEFYLLSVTATDNDPDRELSVANQFIKWIREGENVLSAGKRAIELWEEKQ